LKDLGIPQPSDSGSRDKKDQLLKDCYSYPPEPYKIHHLRILRVLTGLEYNEMILIDDKAENVDKAIELGSGGLLVEGKDALEWADLSTYVLLQNTGSEASYSSSDSHMSVSTTPVSMKSDRFGFGSRGGMNLDSDYELPSFSKSYSNSSTSSSNGSPSSSTGNSINSHNSSQQNSGRQQQASPKPSGSTEGDDSSGSQPCTVCNKIATKRCSRCHGAYYCSTECQRRDWSNHKLHCFSPTTVSERVD